MIISTLLRSAFVALLATWALSGCAVFSNYQEPMVNVVGLEPLPSEGLELRFALKLRLQNPNETAVDFDGISLTLDIDGRGLASGVSDQKGSVPRFGETVVTVPVSISAFSALRQAMGMMEDPRVDAVQYSVQGRFGGNEFGGLRFSGSGTLDLPTANRSQRKRVDHHERGLTQ